MCEILLVNPLFYFMLNSHVMKNAHLYNHILAKKIHVASYRTEPLIYVKEKMDWDISVRTNCVEKFIKSFKKKFVSVGNNHTKFVQKFRDWLDESYVIPPPSNDMPQTPTSSQTTPTTSRGRPSVLFENSSERTKKRKSVEEAGEMTTEHLFFALLESLKKEGRHSDKVI